MISYYDASADDLRVAWCFDIECSRATISVVDRPGDVGQYSSIGIGTDGRPIVAYYQEGTGDLKVVHSRKPDARRHNGVAARYPVRGAVRASRPALSLVNNCQLSAKRRI